MIEFFGRFWMQNRHVSYFLLHCFNFLQNSSVRIENVWLFSTCFYAQIFSKYNFLTYYNASSSIILVKSLKFRNNSKIIATFPSNLLRKMWVWAFLMFCYYFSLEMVLQGMAKNNLTEKDAEIQATLKHTPAWKPTEEKI